MKRIVRLLAFAVVLACALCACKPGRTVLHVYNWADYIKPELVQRFERENDCRVVIDTFDSNESMYAKLKAGAKGYDLIFPTSYMVKLMNEQGMLRPIDKALIPNLANLDPDYLKIASDPECRHSVPYALTVTGLAYLESRVENPEPTWGMLDRADLKGRMTMLNDMRETVGAALKFLGYSLNSTDESQLAEARDVVIRWKNNLAKFENEQYKTGLASGEFLLVHGYSGDILQVKEENDDIQFAVPREGAAISCDDMVIPQHAAQVELAHKFIDFLLDADVAAENIEFIYYLCPNAAAYERMSEELREDPILFPPEDVRAKCEVFRDLGEENVKYTRVWDQIKAAE